MKTRPWAAYLQLLGGMAVVGAYVGFSKLILLSMPVFVLAAIRFGFTTVLMLPWTFPRGGAALVRAHGKTLVWQSFFGNFLFSICMLSGVARTTATAAGLIMSTLPAVVAALSWLLLRERVRAAAGLAIVLAIIGVSTLSLVRPDTSAASGAVVAGNLLMVGALVCEALYVVLGKRLTSAAVTPMQITAWINVVGFFLMLPFAIWQGIGFDFAAVTPRLWMLIALYSVAASILAPSLWLRGLRSVPANEAGVFTVALPVSAALVGVVFLGESLTFAHAIAFACAVTGIFLITAGSARRSVKPIAG